LSCFAAATANWIEVSGLIFLSKSTIKLEYNCKTSSPSEKSSFFKNSSSLTVNWCHNLYNINIVVVILFINYAEKNSKLKTTKKTNNKTRSLKQITKPKEQKKKKILLSIMKVKKCSIIRSISALFLLVQIICNLLSSWLWNCHFFLSPHTKKTKNI